MLSITAWLVHHSTPSSPLHLVRRSDEEQKPLAEIIASNITLIVALDSSSPTSNPSSPPSAPTSRGDSDGGSVNTTQPRLLPNTASAFQPNQTFHVNDSQLLGAGDVKPMTGNLIEWRIGCDLGDVFPIYPPSENPWIALISSALLKPNSLSTNSPINQDEDEEDVDNCSVIQLINIVQAISTKVTGVIMYQDEKATVSFQELTQQTQSAIHNNFIVRNPMISPNSSELLPSMADKLMKRELKGLSKEDLVANLKADQEQRIKASVEQQTVRKMSVTSEPSLENSGSPTVNLTSPGDTPAAPRDPSQNPIPPAAPSLDIMALNDAVLIKILLDNVNSKEKSVIMQMTFRGGAIYPVIPTIPISQIPPIPPTVITERPKADHSLGLFFWIILGSVVLIVGVWVGFGVVEARSLARRRQQISLENVRLRTVDQKVLDTYKIKIFKENDILYSDDEDDEENGNGASLPPSNPRVHSRNPEKHIGDSNHLEHSEEVEELEEKGNYPMSTSNGAQKVFARTDLALPRYPTNPLTTTRRSGSFDETLYGGLEFSTSRRASAQDSIFFERRPSVISTTVMNRNDRCRSWVEGKNSIYDDYGGDSESCYGHDHNEVYKSHAQEGWTNLKIDSLQPLDGSDEKSRSETGPETDTVSGLAISSSLLRRKSLPSLPIPAAAVEMVRRGSADVMTGNSLHIPPTLRHKNRFMLPRKIETDLPSLFVVPTQDLISPTVYGDNASSAGPSTGGFLPPPGWGGERRRSSHSTVAVPDNGRGIAQPNWAGPRGQRLRRSSAQVHRIGIHDSQTNGEESDIENSSDTDDGRGVGQVKVLPTRERKHRGSLEQILALRLDKSSPISIKESKDKESIKSPIEEQKARFTMIGVDLPNIYTPTAGEFSRISFDADELITNSMGYNNNMWNRRRQHQRDEKDGQQQMEELQDIDDISSNDYSGPVNLSTISPTEKTIPVKVSDASISSKSGTSTRQKKQRRRKYDPCAICLEEYEIGDRLRELPCKHFFHAQCIDPWFKDVHGICPVCKRDYSPAGNSDSRPTRRVTNTFERPSGVLAFLSPLSMFSVGAPVGAHYWYAAEASAHI
ncbi:E3 ubiquitin-protein ligase rnf13 [Entomortierella beljakovae]|nr:E3 ubiquitin-protein ligase rnf13 [Entomortierella beljakovae]